MITNSYRQLISEGRIAVIRLSLRDYCRKRHVSYRDFLCWALMSKAATGLPGIFGEDKACPADMTDSSLENPAGLLSGVHIRFADGTTVFIQQGSAHEISSVINVCKP